MGVQGKPIQWPEDFCERWADGATTTRQIAQDIGCSVSSVLLHAKALGLPKRKPGKKPTPIWEGDDVMLGLGEWRSDHRGIHHWHPASQRSKGVA